MKGVRHYNYSIKGLHRYNYADLPVFDMLFGTFRNPRGYEMEAGFYHGASAKVSDMLMFKDVSQPDSADQPTGTNDAPLTLTPRSNP